MPVATGDAGRGAGAAPSSATLGGAGGRRRGRGRRRRARSNRCCAAARSGPIVGVFFVAGLLLSLTPCVLPMLPIVSSIIVGQGGYGGGAGRWRRRRGAAAPRRRCLARRGFALAASYSFGMAIVYTAFGVAAGLAGEGLAATLQNPWVLGAFALGLVALSLSMFGVYELQLPQALAGRVT